jgi:hypothetical protein
MLINKSNKRGWSKKEKVDEMRHQDNKINFIQISSKEING